jgi:hypothetical protein
MVETYVLFKTAFEIQLTKKNVNPRIATGGAMALVTAVQSVTKLEIFPMSTGDLGSVQIRNTSSRGSIRSGVAFFIFIFLHVLDDVNHQMLEFVAVEYLGDGQWELGVQ